MTATYTEETGTATDYAMTKAVCDYVDLKLQLIPEAVTKMLEAIAERDVAGANSQHKYILAVISRLSGYLEGVKEGLK